jgi:hypothetical protein
MKKILIDKETEKDIISLYRDTDINLEELAKTYSIGKPRLKKILDEYSVPIKKPGKQNYFGEITLENYKIPMFNIDCSEDENVIAICKQSGKGFNDYSNKSGALTKHFTDNFPNIKIPVDNIPIKKYYLENGKNWFEDYFDFKIIKKDYKYIKPIVDIKEVMKKNKDKKYLTELSLFKIIFDIDNNSIRNFKVDGYSYDIMFTFKGIKFLVEYDGPTHYSDNDTILRDEKKNKIANDNDFVIIRIPYFIQLDNITFKYYFGFDYNIETSFPHGFITTKYFPSHFVSRGIRRFEKELLSSPVKKQILISLKNQVKNGKEKKQILPDELFYLI